MLQNGGLKIAHLNICSLRNKVIDISEIIKEYNLQVLAISETHLDASINSLTLNIDGYIIYRQDRNLYGGGVACFVQSEIPVKVRSDLSVTGVEAIWLQLHLPHLRPVLVGCCYRPPNATGNYLDQMCEMLDRACDTTNEIYFLGDFNIDWNSLNCALRSKLFSFA